MSSPKEMLKYINTEITDISDAILAKNWDWRDVGGQNFIPRLRRQNSCGSCYVFSRLSNLIKFVSSEFLIINLIFFINQKKKTVALITGLLQ